jgi:hypothetical protein
MSEITNIEFEHIRLDGGTQTREQLNDSSVSEYTEAFKNGAAFPPVTVFFDGSSFWLADGFHRYSACKDAGFDSILANIINGTKRDAVLFSKGANADHGLPRSNAVKRKVVSDMLNDEEWAKWSNEAIAKHCSVSPHTVADVRKSISANAEIPATRTVERNGKTYEQNTANIGKNVATPKPEEYKKPSPVVNPEPYVMPSDVEEFPDNDLDLVQTCQDLEKERDAALDLVKRFEGTDVQKVVNDFDGLANRLACETRDHNELKRKYKFQSDLLKDIRLALGVESNFDILPKLGKS